MPTLGKRKGSTSNSAKRAFKAPRPASGGRTYLTPRRTVVQKANFGAGTRTWGVSKAEKKYIDATFAGALNTTGTIQLIGNVAQGASQSQRIGRKICLKSIQIHGHLDSDTATITNHGRFMLIWDKQPNASLPALSDIFETAVDANAFVKDAQKDRFVVLKDKHWAFAGSIATAASVMTSKTTYVFKYFARLPNLETVYSGATAAIGDITSGALYAIAVGSTAAGTADANCSFNIRIRYLDP